MDELVEKMQIALADIVAFYHKAHKFHWNVTGSDFYQYHLLFQRIYEETYTSIDDFGEQIRAIDAYAPYSPQEIARLTNLVERPLGDSHAMVLELYNDCVLVQSSLMAAYKAADKFNEIGLSNFLQDRFDGIKVLQYLLRSTMKGEQE